MHVRMGISTFNKQQKMSEWWLNCEKFYSSAFALKGCPITLGIGVASWRISRWALPLKPRSPFGSRLCIFSLTWQQRPCFNHVQHKIRSEIATLIHSQSGIKFTYNWFKGALDNFGLIPLFFLFFFQKSWDFPTIRNVYLCSDSMLNLTCNLNLHKICEFFLQRPFLKVCF